MIKNISMFFLDGCSLLQGVSLFPVIGSAMKCNDNHVSCVIDGIDL